MGSILTTEALPAPTWQSGPRWHLSLLGGVRLQDATTVHTRFATRAITALLARLALWPQRDHPREELMELLWPDVDAATGRRRLRQALSLLKAVLEPAQAHPWPVLQADRLSVRVVPGTIACDVHTFETQARAGQREAALACWRGEFMPGYFDEWIHDERTRLTAVHDRLTDAQEREQARGQLPASLPREALPQSPAPTRGGLAVSADEQRTGAPGYLTRYFSDPQQFERLLGQVLAHRLVSLLGPGGSGKTRLAVNLVEQLGRPGTLPDLAIQASPFALVRFVPLAAVQTREQLLGALQTALEITASPGAVDNLVARLDGVRALLVLDNAEQFADVAGSVLDPLTAALPQLHLLVTSRRRIGLAGEREFQIEPMPVPPAGASLQAAAASPAVGLFVDRAGAVRGDFHLGERNHTSIVALVRALEGMPLAIELAASRIRAFTPADMLSKLRGPNAAPGDTPGLDLLSRPEPRSTLQSRHASMQRTIEWSWRQLSADQQRLAAAMAVFPGGCDAAMLAGVHSGGDVPPGLEQLHAHCIIHEQRTDRAPDGGTEADDLPRFQLYVPLREYAAAQFDAAHSAHWRSRQRTWALAFLQGLPATPPLARVRAELTNLSAAFASAAADAAGDDTVGLVLGLYPLHEGVTLPSETLVHATAAVQTCADAVLRSRGCSALAPLLLTAGDTPEARRLADAALEDAPPQGAARAWALHALALVHWRGTLSPAATVWPWFEEAVLIAEDVSDPDLLASLLCLMSMVRYGVDRDAEAARVLAARAQAVWESTGNRHGVNLARHNVAVYEFHVGRREHALATWDAISEEAAILQDTRRLAIANSARGVAASDMRRWPQALQAFRQSLRQSWRAMRLYEVAYDLWNLPRVLAHLRQPQDAQCLMAFASQFWQQRFGALTATDWRHVRMVERMVALQIDARAMAAATARGRHMTLAEAVALALGD